jgi:hypothetical protein
MRCGVTIGLLMVGLGLVISSQPVSAGRLYSWDDAQGVTHFSSRPPQNKTRGIQELKANSRGTITPLPEAERLYADTETLLQAGESGKQQETCAYYRSLLARYQTQGARAFNPQTGKAEVLHGQAATQAVRHAKEAVRVYCRR